MTGDYWDENYLRQLERDAIVAGYKRVVQEKFEDLCMKMTGEAEPSQAVAEFRQDLQVCRVALEGALSCTKEG